MSDETRAWYDDFKAIKREQRGGRLMRNMKTLRLATVRYEVRNGGYHVVLKPKGMPVVNFWPSSGLWMVDGRKYRGDAKSMLGWIRKQQRKANP